MEPAGSSGARTPAALDGDSEHGFQPGMARASSLRRGTGRPPRDQCFRRAITCKSSFLGLIYGPGVLLAPQDYAARTTQVIRYQAACRFLPGRPWLGCDNEIPAEAR